MFNYNQVLRGRTDGEAGRLSPQKLLIKSIEEEEHGPGREGEVPKLPEVLQPRQEPPWKLQRGSNR